MDTWILLATKGRCRDTTVPDIFFPPAGGSGIQAVRAAKQVCGTCPVRAECLDWAFTIHMSAGQALPGIWGGTTERERRALNGARTERMVDEWLAAQAAAV